MSETNTNPEARVVEAVARAMCKTFCDPDSLVGYVRSGVRTEDPAWRSWIKPATAAISAHTKALAAEGMAIVPKEPTEAMRNAALKAWDNVIVFNRHERMQCALADAIRAATAPTLPPAGDESP